MVRLTILALALMVGTLCSHASHAQSFPFELGDTPDYARLNTKSQTRYIISGRNEAVGTAEEMIWGVGGTYPGFIETASTISVVSDDVDDTAAGAGAQTVLIQGVDENWFEQNVILPLSGTTPAVTTHTFLRVNRVVVLTVGVCGNQAPTNCTNEGTINVTATTGAVQMARIPPATGISQLGIFSVPMGQTAVMRSIFVSVAGNDAADFHVNQRVGADASAPYNARQRILHLSDTAGAESLTLHHSAHFAEKTDVFFSAQLPSPGDAADVTVVAQFDLYDNNVLGLVAP